MKCFVIMPFGNPQVDADRAKKLASIYSNWIKPAVESLSVPTNPSAKLSCHRADQIFRPGEIISHLIENLISADIVVADLSDRNPNVFYELGVRHAVANNCILIADNLDDIPFDLRQLRTIIYQYEPDSMLQLRDSLQQAILEILEDPSLIDNPVRRFIYQKELDRASREPKSQENELVKNIVSELTSLRRELSEQTNEFRKIMKVVTATPEEIGPRNPQTNVDLTSFEGTWKDLFSGSTFYVRLLNGELIVPYTYGFAHEVTGYVYNYKVIDRTVFGRFKWFHSRISGYLFLRFENDGRMKGGWWYNEDVPKEVMRDISRVTDALPNMNRLLLEKAPQSEVFPPYVEKYFRTR